MSSQSNHSFIFRYGYAIYSSVGSLDLDCSEKLSLGMIKDMLCAPVILSLRSELRHEFDAAWLSLSNSDQSVFNYAAHTQTTASRMDPDEFQITYKIFRKIMTKTSFTKYLEMARPFGKLGTRYICNRVVLLYFYGSPFIFISRT